MRIGWGAAFRFAVALAAIATAVWLLYALSHLFLLLFAGAVLAAGLARVTGRLERAGAPRPVAVLTPFATLGVLAAALAAAIVAPLIGEAESLTRYLRGAYDVPPLRELLLDAVGLARRYVPILAPFGDELAGAARQLADQVESSASGAASEAGAPPVGSHAVRATTGVLSAAFSLLFSLVIALYLLWDRDRVRRYLLSLVPAAARDRSSAVLDRVAARIGGWLLGQSALCAIVGLATFAALRLIGVPFAVGLALFAALAELVPLIGPITAAALAVAAAASQSAPQALATLLFFLAFQQIDGYVLGPRVLGGAVRIHPLAVLLAVGVGAELFGIAGALLAPPAAAAAAVLLDEWRRPPG